MRFAFLIHPIDVQTSAIWRMASCGSLRSWGADLLGVCRQLHEAVAEVSHRPSGGPPDGPRVADELGILSSPLGASAEGRLYEISMMPDEILEDPNRAVEQMERAVEMAIEWGAEIVGLGSLTGIVGGRGTYLAETYPLAVTTGNSMTVYSALQTLDRVAEEFELDLRNETVAIVGIPGSIATAVASMVAPKCGRLILVGRRSCSLSQRLARKLGAEFTVDLKEALASTRIVLSATSSGQCIDENLLLPGSIVIDVGVPSDVCRAHAPRNDVLILTGGFVRVPPTMPLDSSFLWFQHGIIPSCLGETMVLALTRRAECFSLGRTLSLDGIQEIGGLARQHGFDFSQLCTCGRPLEESQLVRFQKLCARQRGKRHVSSASPLDRPDLAMDLYARHINPVWPAIARSSGMLKAFVRGDGCYLFDEEGKRYLDFVAGFGSVNLGHNHPEVTGALIEAMHRQAPGFAQSAVNPFAAAAAKELASLSPEGLEMVTFGNSGTEAIEAALKLARKATGRTGFLYCEGGFHGKTMGALSLAGNADYRRPFEPMLSDCEVIPYGDAEALRVALKRRPMAAFVVEPIQGEGGVIMPPDGYLREAESLCRASGTLLVVDEIQTGLGRTGKLFAVEHEGVSPDIMTVAKSLGGGLMPIGAMLSRRDLWMRAYGTVQHFALHSSTFAGGSLACAAALAALHCLVRERLAENATARGMQLKQGISAICRKYGCVREVRGRGLLMGVEFQPLSPSLKAHWKHTDRSGIISMMMAGQERLLDSFHVMHAMVTLLHAHGIYAQPSRSNPLVLRMQPPLTITAEEVKAFIRAFDATCREIDYPTRLMDSIISKSSIGELDAEPNGSQIAAKPQGKVKGRRAPAVAASSRTVDDPSILDFHDAIGKFENPVVMGHNDHSASLFLG